MNPAEPSKMTLQPHLSPAGAWAFAIGTSIGWGSLVVTNNTYLAQAGPLGSILGLLIGAAMMIVISRNYAYLINAFPESGGAYAFVREVFGHDHGFLSAWFLSLTYLAMLWANATSLPLFARYFFGDVFTFGKLYTLFGYDVFLGEALLSIAGILVIAFLCSRFRRALSRAMICLSLIFTLGILVCLGAALLSHPASNAASETASAFLSPLFLPNRSAFSQVILIACISPWAFIGFESISHGAEEFSFRRSRIFRILVFSVLSTTLLYIAVFLLSVTAYPPAYSSWLAYIRDLDHLEGIQALPAFYAADRYLGTFGVTLLMASLLSLIVTSLIGNIAALSRLFHALALDGILPRRFGKLNHHALPGNAILLIAALSSLIPFLGRTAISWIVDVTTLGATLIYGFVSAAALKLARSCGDRSEFRTGVAGLIICVFFGAYTLLPNLFMSGSMAPESFFLFVVWALLGFVYFRVILKHDAQKRFGKSIIVWIALLSLVLFVSLVWMSRAIMDATNNGLSAVETWYTAAFPAAEDADPAGSALVASQLRMIRLVCARSIAVVVVVFALSLWILLTNYNLMSRRAVSSELQLGHVQSLAFTDPLTGVRSKLAYAEREREINARIGAGEESPFALVVCDVNGLKHVNDSLGHKAGDDYLVRSARLICNLFDHSPVFRTGGDEFTVLLTGQDYENRRDILAVLHARSVENIAPLPDPADYPAGVAAPLPGPVVSAGLADYIPGSGEDLRAIFERADARMYEEKKRLKNLGAATRL